MTTNVTATAAPAAIPTLIGAFARFQNYRQFSGSTNQSSFRKPTWGLETVMTSEINSYSRIPAASPNISAFVFIDSNFSTSFLTSRKKRCRAPFSFCHLFANIRKFILTGVVIPCTIIVDFYTIFDLSIPIIWFSSGPIEKRCSRIIAPPPIWPFKFRLKMNPALLRKKDVVYLNIAFQTRIHPMAQEEGYSS